MTINRKQLLRYSGAAAAGAALGAIVRGLLGPGPAGEGYLRPTEGWNIPPAPPGRSPPPAREVVGNESFSQCGEDLVVAFTTGYLGMRRLFTYLDVGANDPVKFSNTYYFYRKGHRGVLVEPNRSLCDRLRAKRPEDATVQAGIGAAAGEADYYIMTHDGLNTFSKQEAEHQVEASRGKIAIREVIRMPLLNINDVMDEHFHGAPDFLSVDTEGLDLAILESIDYGRFRPGIICAETLISNSRKTRPEIPEFLATKGYVVRGGSFVNTIFVDSKRL
jgi:FkbM family methyltransferase